MHPNNFARRAGGLTLFSFVIIITLGSYYPHQKYFKENDAPNLSDEVNRMKIDTNSRDCWEKEKDSIRKKVKHSQKVIKDIINNPDKYGLKGDSLTTKLKDLNDRVTILQATLKNLEVLEKSTQIYSLKDTNGLEGETLFCPKTGKIIFKVGCIESFVHETTHGGQFESLDIAFDSSNGHSIAQDLQDEVAAYKAQFAFNPNSMPNSLHGRIPSSLAEITPLWVEEVIDKKGEHPYGKGGSAHTGLIPVNVNSSLEILLKAYPDDSSSIKGLPANFPLKSPTFHLHFKH